MEEKKSVVNYYGERLVGLRTYPSKRMNRYPTVCLVHGFGATKEEGGMFDELAINLAQGGIMAYRFDFSGRGESEGIYSETSLTKMKSELERIMDHIRADSFVDVNNIGIFAQSLGTAVTTALSPVVKAMIFTGSIAHPADIIGKPKKWDIFNPKGTSVRVKKSSSERIRMGSQFWSDANKYDLTQNVSQIKCPIFFINGSEDYIVPISEMESLYNCANVSKEKLILEGADHGLRPQRERLYEIVVKWFKEKLR